MLTESSSCRERQGGVEGGEGKDGSGDGKGRRKEREEEGEGRERGREEEGRKDGGTDLLDQCQTAFYAPA